MGRYIRRHTERARHTMIEYWKDIALIADDAYFTKWVKETGRLDHHQGFLKVLQPYIKGTVLDIGANIGTHTIFYAKHATQVLAFEPNKIAFDCLSYNLRNHPNCKLYNNAVANHTGKIDIIPQGDNYGAVYTVPGTSVSCLSIDSLELESCDYMKIDVEGDEVAVLLGATETIHKYRPVMCIECNEHTLIRKGMTGDYLEKCIHNLGYTTSIRKPQDISTDLICIPN